MSCETFYWFSLFMAIALAVFGMFLGYQEGYKTGYQEGYYANGSKAKHE